MTARVTRSEKVLTMLAEKSIISEAGHDWLVAALDPMHDTQLKNLQGWPDVESAPSVVRCIKQSMTISAPSAITPGNNWDCLIEQWPFQMPQNMQVLSANGTTFQGNALTWPNLAQTGVVGGVTAYAAAAGNNIGYSAGNTFAGGLSLADPYLEGASRIIASGLEIVNTTATLYRQGQVTVFRQPAPPNDYALYLATRGTRTTPFTAKNLRLAPRNQADAMLLSGSRQWAASEGAYLVTPFVGIDNPAILNTPISALYNTETTQEVPAGPNVLVANYFALGYFYNDAAAIPTWSPFHTKFAPIHNIGALFTGLSYETTLTITWNIYVETFPTPSDPDIVVLASPSAQFDPMALEIFSRALSSLPVGVPAGMNAWGDWFEEVVSSVLEAFPVVAAALGQPELAALSPILKAGFSYITQPSPNSKPKSSSSQKQKQLTNGQQKQQKTLESGPRSGKRKPGVKRLKSGPPKTSLRTR